MKYQRFKIHLTTVGIIAGIVVSTYGFFFFFFNLSIIDKELKICQFFRDSEMV